MFSFCKVSYIIKVVIHLLNLGLVVKNSIRNLRIVFLTKISNAFHNMFFFEVVQSQSSKQVLENQVHQLIVTQKPAPGAVIVFFT